MRHRITPISMSVYKETLRAALPLPDRAFFDSWDHNAKSETYHAIAHGRLSLPDAVSRVQTLHAAKRREMFQHNPLKQPSRPTTPKDSRP